MLLGVSAFFKRDPDSDGLVSQLNFALIYRTNNVTVNMILIGPMIYIVFKANVVYIGIKNVRYEVLLLKPCFGASTCNNAWTNV